MVLIRLQAFLKQDVPFKKHALWTYPEQLHNGRDRELLFEMKLSDSPLGWGWGGGVGDGGCV